MTGIDMDEVGGVRYFDREGQPISMRAWGELHNDLAYKRVDLTQIGDVDVSTVWLGLNHRWGEGPPLIFETMVFGGDFSDYQERYATEDEAVIGHQRIVGALTRGLDPGAGRGGGWDGDNDDPMLGGMGQ